MRNPYRALEKKLGYRFRKKPLLHAALTHRSYRYESHETDTDNQRLEFLGDAALGLVTAAYLFTEHPHRQEGELTKMRSRITSSKPLAELGAQCDLGDYLRLGKGESRTGGHNRPSNLTDAFEAVLGAAFLDGGIRAVQKIFDHRIVPFLRDMQPAYASDNPKGDLQELAQRHWQTTPRYRVLAEAGPSHAREYTIEVELNDTVYGRGQGTNKRTAEMEAASEALERIAKDERASRATSR